MGKNRSKLVGFKEHKKYFALKKQLNAIFAIV